MGLKLSETDRIGCECWEVMVTWVVLKINCHLLIVWFVVCSSLRWIDMAAFVF